MVNKKTINKISYYVGITIVIGTHIGLLVMGGIPEGQEVGHSVINLFGGSLLAYSWFTK